MKTAMQSLNRLWKDGRGFFCRCEPPTMPCQGCQDYQNIKDELSKSYNVDDLINIVILALAKPEGHDPFLAAKTSFAISAVNALAENGLFKLKPPPATEKE